MIIFVYGYQCMEESMVLTYKEALSKYKNAYQINKKIQVGELYKIEDGIYSDRKYLSELEILVKKYPKTILSGENAFYAHDLTDVIPEDYCLVTSQSAAPITDSRVRQVYERNRLLELGAISMTIDGAEIRIYDKERMLIELLRNKNKLPYDYYKEIIYKYRQIINTLDLRRIQEYAEIFPKSGFIKRALDEEVL